jgi:hypothetical protein
VNRRDMLNEPNNSRFTVLSEIVLLWLIFFSVCDLGQELRGVFFFIT